MSLHCSADTNRNRTIYIQRLHSAVSSITEKLNGGWGAESRAAGAAWLLSLRQHEQALSTRRAGHFHIPVGGLFKPPDRCLGNNTGLYVAYGKYLLHVPGIYFYRH